MNIENSKLKTGKRIIKPYEKPLKADELIFREEERGREMFILKEGEIKITQKKMGKEVELARLGAGAIIGEMSLFDNMPRSATAITTKPSRVIVINENTFKSVLENIPNWIVLIIKVVVSRLRDINKNVIKSPLRHKETGIISLLYLTCKNKNSDNNIVLDYNNIIYNARHTCGLEPKVTETIMFDIAKKELIELKKDTKGHTFIIVKDIHKLSALLEN